MKKRLPIAPERALRGPSLIAAFLALGGVLLSPAGSMAQVAGAGSTSTNFEKIGMGARAVAMGESFTAVADDSTAVYWNPAGLPLARGTQFSLTHGEWLQGVTDEYLAFSQNLQQDGAFGGGIEYLDTGSFPGALEDASGNYNGIGPNISASDYAGSLAYGQNLGNWLNGEFFKRSYVGLKATIVGQNVVNVGSSGLAFDLGYIFEVARKSLYLGAVVYNLGTQVQNYTQPVIYKLGGSYKIKNALMKKAYNLIAIDIDGHIDTGFKANIGDEYKMVLGKSAVALRAGYRSGSDLGTLAGLTSGIGISHHFDDFEAGLDYAFVPYGVLGSTHRISLNLAFGGDVPPPQAFIKAGPSFILGSQTVSTAYSAKGEEPIERWKASIVTAKGMLVKSISGKGNPPAFGAWDGRDERGALVPEGYYSFHLEVTDEDGVTGQAVPAQVFAQWVPKKVPYQYAFQIPGDLLFDSGKDQLKSAGYDAIQKAAAAIRQRYPNSVILIAGHTDNVNLTKGAPFPDNLALSLARAQAVKNYLTQNGLDPKLLSVEGFGDTKPVASNATAEGKAKNRRVELIVSGVVEASAVELVAEGREMLKLGRQRDALDRFLMAIQADSRNGTAYRLAGDCYYQLGEKAEAVEAYRRSIEYNPTDTALKAWLDNYGPLLKPVGDAQGLPTLPMPTEQAP